MRFRIARWGSRLGSSAALAAAVAGFTGCSSPRASDIGTNHVAVLSVTRWDDYQAVLQPKFELSASQALAAALPDTLQFQQAIQHSFDAALALRLAPSAVLPAGFGDGKSGAGFIPSTTQPSTTAPATTQPLNLLNPSGLGTDAHLQFLAATALYQEVKLINRYVHDAAIPNNHRAYVVRTQISSMPKRRDGAYDTYVDLSMFLNPFNQPLNTSPGELFANTATRLMELNTRLTQLGARPGIGADEIGRVKELADRVEKWNGELNRPPATTQRAVETLRGLQLNIRDALRPRSTTKSISDGRGDPPNTQAATRPANPDGAAPLPPAPPFPPDGPWTESRQPSRSLASEEEALADLAQNIQDNLERTEQHRRLPIVVPLLVTDEVEGALAARRADDLQRLALALAASYAGIGTLRVRIGARMTGATTTKAGWVTPAKQSENYRSLARTHNVSLLVLLPASTVVSRPANVYFGTHTKFVDVHSGETVEDAPGDEASAVSKLVSRFSEDYTRLYEGRESAPRRERSEGDRGGRAEQRLRHVRGHAGCAIARRVRHRSG